MILFNQASYTIYKPVYIFEYNLIMADYPQQIFAGFTKSVYVFMTSLR